MVEDTEKSAATVDAERPSSATKIHQNEGEYEAEEGEIIGAKSDDAGRAAEPPAPKHPLEHSWTFWFDNRSAKSKQAAWGSSIRPIYTFSTVEDFWSYGL